MTNEVSVEEAIEIFKLRKKLVLKDSREDKVLDTTIKALETASCIKEKCAYCPHCENCDVDDETLEIKALEQQPCEKCEVGNPCLYCEYDFTEKKMKESCEDAISREAVKDMLTAEWTKYMPMESDVSLSFVLDKIRLIMYKFAISTETVVRSLSQITGIRYRESYKEYQFNECPYCHTKQKQKFAVNKSTGQFQCFRASCSAKGNLYTLAKDFEIDLGREINEYYGIGEQRHYRMFKKELTEKIEPTDIAMNYLNSRGISSEVVRKYKITTNKDNNIVFPFIDQSGVMQFVKYRNPSPEEGQSKEWAETNCKPILFGMHQCNLENKTLIVTEGQIDSLSVVEAGFENAVSVPTGKNGFSWTPYCWDWMQNFEKIIVFGDHENNNITLLKEFTDRWSSKVWHVREEDYKDCKDANEILRKYGAEQIRACVENAEQLPLSNVINLNDVEYIDPYEIPKIKTGIKVVDRLLCGGLPLGQMVLLTGKAGDGKSTLASQLLVNALDQGFKCFAYSGELPNYLFRSWIDFQAAGTDNVEERTSLWQPEPFFAVKEDVKKKIGAWYDRKFWRYHLFRTLLHILHTSRSLPEGSYLRKFRSLFL